MQGSKYDILHIFTRTFFVLRKLASVFEKDFTIDVLLHKKLRKAKIKALKDEKTSTMPMPMPTPMQMLMPRFQCRGFQMALLLEI